MSARRAPTAARRAALPPPAAAPPAASSSAGRSTYAPASFDVLVDDAGTAVAAALGDGKTLIEVEFPALPGDKDGYAGSSDQYIDNNTQFALAAGRRLAKEGRTVRVLVPDAVELKRSSKVFAAALASLPGVTMGHLREAAPPGGLAGLARMFGGGADAAAETPKPPPADVYIAVNASTIELPDAEAYFGAVEAGGAAFVFFNMELDTLRADLGLFGFPPKALQHRFLSRITPAFYVRPRDYAQTVPVPPYLINYSGALFREFPGPWQVMLKQDNGEYACVAEDRLRYTLGEAKLEMAGAVGLGDAVKTGTRNSTWWEDDFDVEGSHDWRK